MKKNKGFTLIEIVLALTIGVVIFGFLLSIYNLSINSINKSEDRAELSQNSRVIIERISRDIRQAKEIVTALNATEAEGLSSEIEVQDGHNTTTIQYVRYYIKDGGKLYRQLKKYYFQSDPNIYVKFNSTDSFGNPPLVAIDEDKLIGEYISSIGFYGVDVITVKLNLAKRSINHSTQTSIYVRNL